MSAPTLNPIDADLLAEIERDALEGLPARSNAAYAEAIGRHKDSAKHAIARLEQRGLIQIEIRDNNRRRIAVPDSETVTGWTDLGRKDRLKAVKRPCLSCREEFRSEGNGHRICDTCKRRGGPPDFFFVSSDRDRARRNAARTGPAEETRAAIQR